MHNFPENQFYLVKWVEDGGFSVVSHCSTLAEHDIKSIEVGKTYSLSLYKQKQYLGRIDAFGR